MKAEVFRITPHPFKIVHKRPCRVTPDVTSVDVNGCQNKTNIK